MIQFIFGRSGSGKTELMRQNIRRDAKEGRSVLLLIPEQEVLSNETALCSSSAEVALNTQVLSFRRLANTVFRKYGGLKYNYITKGERTVIMWRALCSVAPSLRKFADVSIRDKSLLCALSAQISEFKAYCVSPADLERAADALTDAQKDLKNKLYDISVIYAAYNSAISLKYSDPEDDLTLLRETLEEYDYFSDKEVYIDSFIGFTEAQYKIIELIFKNAKNVTVSLCCDRGDDLMYSYVNETEKNLRSLAVKSHKEIKDDILLTEKVRFTNNELKYAEAHIWDFAAKEYAGEVSHITLCASHDSYAEAEYIARDIKKKIRGGKRYRDFAIITRNTEDYTGIIDAVFEKHDIPLFMSLRTDVKLLPSVRFVLSALALKISNFRTDDVISYVKTGLSSLTSDECDELEDYVTRWSISGRRWYDEYEWNMNPRGYTEKMTEEDSLTLVRINEERQRILSPLLPFFEAFTSDATVKDITSALYRFMKDSELYENTAQIYANEYDAAKAWNVMIEAIGELVACCAEEKADAQTYRDLLCAILDEKDIGSIPDAVDNVTFGDASLIRVSNAKDVYLCGVTEGRFPASAAVGTFFSDTEKKTLEALGVKLSPDSETDNSRELFYFYRAISCASENVTVTYPKATLSGNALRPSLAVKRITKLFPNCTVYDDEKRPPLDNISDYASGFEAAALFRDTPLGKALIEEYSKNPDYAHKIDSLNTPISDTECSLKKETAEKIYNGDTALTQSRIDTFAKCHFSYNCKYLLSINSQNSPEYRSADIGNFIHMLLERFMSHICNEGEIRLDISKEETEEIIDALIEDYIRRVFGDKRNAGARLLTLITRLRRTSLLLINNILDEFRNSDFRPAFFELQISTRDDDSVAPVKIPLPDGTNVFLYGKIDRVDTLKKGDDVYIRIVDYKTGNKTLSLDRLRKGQEMQMILYMYSLWKTKDKKFIEKIGAEKGEIIPAGVEYYIAKAPVKSFLCKTPSEEVIDAADRAICRNGIRICEDTENDIATRYDVKDVCTLEQFGKLSDEITKTVSEITLSIKSGESSAKWLGDEKNECEYCDMRPICRKER